jgi:non-ribosomal peptide synthase protein (TIGR01720 family)
LSDEELTVVNLPVTFWHRWIAEHVRSNAELPSALRLVIVGSEKVLVEQLSLWQRAAAGDRVDWLNAYGLTEAAITSCIYAPSGLSLKGYTASVPIGRPIDGAWVYILNQSLQPTPVGVPGELYIGGAGPARCYHNQPALTACKFIPNPFARDAGARLFRSGDYGRFLSDGNIEFLYRSDSQVKVRGFRVELGEIEAVLSQHPLVSGAAVTAREHTPGANRLTAYIVAQSRLTPRELRRYLMERLPEYMTPVAFVMLDELPSLPSGKINREALPESAISSNEADHGYVPPVVPQTEAEKILVEIWSRALGLERVGVTDNFFALGGDSILSLQIVAQADRAGLPLTPKQIFQHQTIAELAAVVLETSPSRAEQDSVSGPVPLTPIQCWFFEQKMAQRHHYNQAVLLEAKCPLDPDLLRRSFRHLLSHHDALRLRFTQTQSGWHQFNAPEPGADEANDFFSLEWDRLQSVRGPHWDGQTEVCPTEQIASIQAGLNLERGPLVRAALLRGADEQPDRLLIAIHHLAVDAVSWQILLEDLQTAYRQLSRGEQVELPPKTTSFKRWAEALREYVERERQELELEAEYWLSPSRREVGRIPVDARGENVEGDARSLEVWLDEGRTRALLRDAQAAYRTEASDLLLAALAEAFREWTGERRLLVDLEGHGREEVVGDVNVARTVGWFTTIYPVLLEAPAERPWERDAGRAIKSVKEQLRRAPNKGINYGMLRYLGGKKEEMEEAPQAEVSFNYLGRLEQGVEEGEMLRLTSKTLGRVRGERNERRYLLDVEASVTGGRLRVEWEYNERVHRRETIERLAGAYLVALERLIDHCLSEGAGGFIPSDFPDAELSQTDLDDLIAILSDEPEKY